MTSASTKLTKLVLQSPLLHLDSCASGGLTFLRNHADRVGKLKASVKEVSVSG